MTSLYQHHDGENLAALLQIRRRNLAHLEQQAAKFGTSNVPVSLNNQIFDEQREIDAIIAELKSRSSNQKFDGATQPVVEPRTVPQQKPLLIQKVSNTKPSILVIGHSLTNVPSTPWSGNEPNITDYDFCIFDFTTKEKWLPSIDVLSVARPLEYDMSGFILWMGIREQVERTLMSGASICVIVNRDVIIHPDAPREVLDEHKFQSILPFTLYGRTNAPGQVISLIDTRYEFYFSKLGRWNFVFTNKIRNEFVCFEPGDFEVNEFPIAVNRLNETLSVHLAIRNKATNSTGNLYLLPRSTIMTSEETVQQVLSHINLFYENIEHEAQAEGSRDISRTSPKSPFSPPGEAKLAGSLRIFLCHSSGDKPRVRGLYQLLRVKGFQPWLDEEDLLPGQDWQREIPKAVRAADVVIICLSRASITKAGYIQKEIRYALDVAEEQPEGSIFLIPLKLEECDAPDRLSQLQWVNLYDESGFDRLVRALLSRAESLKL